MEDRKVKLRMVNDSQGIAAGTTVEVSAARAERWIASGCAEHGTAAARKAAAKDVEVVPQDDDDGDAGDKS